MCLQGLPLGSGMGSSAASAAAAAWAVNGLFGAPLSKAELIPAGLASEATVSGYHADNIGPALMGGFVLIRWGGDCVYEGGGLCVCVRGWGWGKER
jgi:homoserine kinase